MKYDIAVVGGGPAGLSAAYAAAREGARVALFEKDPSFGHNVRTSGVTWIKDMERFGIPKIYFNPIRNFTFISPNNEARIMGSYDSACVLDIKKTYQYLASEAAKEGSNLFVRSNVIDVKRNPKESTTRLKVITPKGLLEFDATLIIDASGFNSYVANKLNHVTGWKRYGMGVEYECYCDYVDKDTLVLMVGNMYSEAGYSWVFPLSEHRIRIGVGIGRPESMDDPLNKLNYIIDNKLPPLNKIKNIQPIEVHTGFIPNEGLRKNTIFDGLILVGDTAGQANPLVLEGIRYAIEFGRLAGKVGVNSLSNKSVASSLKDYEIITRKMLFEKINSALKVQSRWMGHSDKDWDKELDIIKELTIDEFLDFIKSEFTTSKMVKLALHHPRLIARQLFNLVLENKN